MAIATNNGDSDAPPVGQLSDTTQVADQSDALVQLSPDAQEALLEVLPSDHLGAIIQELKTEDAVSVCEALGTDRLGEVFDATSPDIAADVLKYIAPDAADTALASMSTAADVVPLAAFLPVIAGQSGIAGTQTLMLIILSITLGEVSPSNTT